MTANVCLQETRVDHPDIDGTEMDLPKLCECTNTGNQLYKTTSKTGALQITN